MYEENFKNIINILDKEIKLYTEMRNLYIEKREILVKNNILCYNIYTEKTVGSNCSEGTLMYFEKLRYEVFASNRMQCKILSVISNFTVWQGKSST